MKKQLGILLLVFIAAVGLSGTASAQAIDNNNVPMTFNHNVGHGWNVAWKHTWKWSAHPKKHSYRFITRNMPQYRQTVVMVLKRSHTTGKWYVAWRNVYKWSAHPTKNSYRAIKMNMPQYRQTTVTVLKKGHYNWLKAATVR